MKTERSDEQGDLTFMTLLSKNKSLRNIHIINKKGLRVPLDPIRLKKTLMWAAKDGGEIISIESLTEELGRNIFDGIDKSGIADAFILSTVSFIENDPTYSYMAARLLLKKLYKEITTRSIHDSTYVNQYRELFVNAIKMGVSKGVFDKRLLDFDLQLLANALCVNRDDLFGYMGLRTLYERYFMKIEDKRFEMPQSFWMRVAMGVALNEENKTERAIEFYHAMSQFLYIPSTPTLLHSGLARAQLSSCFLATVEDDLKHIFKCIGDNAQLSKWSGGVAYDWTNIRGTGAQIKSINVESQGLVPFLKIANDVTSAINRSGKRRSAACVYLETWHLDIEDFLDLRRNTGDERRRTHDINTANWIPDLFMKRVNSNDNWTLFSPDEVSDLHHLYGKAFEDRYHEYEQNAKQGMIRKYKTISAVKLWRKMLSRLFETGHPWITFKDPCNVRSPQDHVGVVHCSNLCTEITLNTSPEETAVCNLGSINLAKHVGNGRLNIGLMNQTVATAMRMLDNVIDINFYPTKEAEIANFRHRPVGLGVMGFQDALYMLDIAFDSEEALDFADSTQEQISYSAILGSSQLARERGSYKSFKGSKWDRGILPQDTIDLLEKERGISVEIQKGGKLDWQLVKDHIRLYGMRNSNTMAIAPTATISNIAGCYPCIEPIYKNVYVKANMSGEFTIINSYLVHDLKYANLWGQEVLDQLKYHDGSVQNIEIIPEHIRNKYKEAFEIDPEWLLKITATRGKWLDQSQSHNVFMKGVSGKKLHDIYMKAWKYGLKTMYYLRTLGATGIEKATLDSGKFGFTQTRKYMNSSANPKEESANSRTVEKSSVDTNYIPARKACYITDPDCDVCQ